MQPMMEPGTLVEEVQGIKQGSAGFTTNLFATPEQSQIWIRRGVLSCVRNARSLLLLRRDRNFHRVYHVAADLKSLRDALAALTQSLDCPEVITADLVGFPRDVEAVANVYLENGFHDYTSLFRMSRLGGSRAQDESESDDPEVVVAEPSDVPAICSFLDRLLDPLSEQNPEADEISSAVARNNVLIVRRGRELGGMLFYETVGLTTVLRYWYVNDGFRNQGIGARLMRSFLRHCRNSKRIVLWVIATNDDAIAKYRHYEFQSENLTDRVLVRRRN